MTQSGRALLRQRRLELVGADRQAVADDRLHPPLAEGAARLLVGEDVLQRHDLFGHADHARLRGVDHRQPLVELAEVGAGRLGVAFEPGAEPRADIVEPLRHDAREIGLARAQPFAHRAEPAAELGVRLGERGELRLELAPPRFRGFRLAPPRRIGAQQR